MRGTTRILVVAGVIVAVAALGVLLGWFGGKPAPQALLPPLEPGSSAPAGSEPANRSPFFTRPPQPKDPAAKVEPVEVSATDANLITNWEDKVDEVLRADTEPGAKAKVMLEMFPRVPEAGRVEVAQHIANLLADEYYAPLGQYLVSTNTPAAVADVLMADLLNRPNSVKVPLLLEVARSPDHTKSGAAKDLLALYLAEDYGTNWNVWEKKVGEWLKANPD